MESMHVLENITCCSLFNCVISIILTSNNHLFLSSKAWDAALNSLSRSVLVMIFASFSDSFKCFHTADMFAALVHAFIWLRHCSVHILYGLFTYLAETKSFFQCYFRPNNFSGWAFGASLMEMHKNVQRRRQWKCMTVCWVMEKWWKPAVLIEQIASFQFNLKLNC